MIPQLSIAVWFIAIFVKWAVCKAEQGAHVSGGISLTYKSATAYTPAIKSNALVRYSTQKFKENRAMVLPGERKQ
jgi:hypothetical protein